MMLPIGHENNVSIVSVNGRLYNQSYNTVDIILIVYLTQNFEILTTDYHWINWTMEVSRTD